MKLRMHHLLTPACLALAALGGCGGGDDNSAAPAQSALSLTDKCPTLTNTNLDPTTTITSASIVSGSFTPPGAAAPLTGLPEFCRRVVAKHRHMPRIAIDAARDAIQRAATAKTRTRDDELLIEALERVTGMRIDALAALTKRWPAT